MRIAMAYSPYQALDCASESGQAAAMQIEHEKHHRSSNSSPFDITGGERACQRENGSSRRGLTDRVWLSTSWFTFRLDLHSFHITWPQLSAISGRMSKKRLELH